MKLATRLGLAAGVAAAALLAGCGNIDSASFPIHGPQHSLSLTRTQPYFWSSGWELDIVTSRFPECTRRHHIQPVPGDFKVELYRSLEGSYILRQDNNWYVTETQKCRLQQFQAPPREAGDLLGVFEEKEGVFKFVAAPGAASPAAAAPAALPAPAQAIPPAAAPVTR